MRVGRKPRPVDCGACGALIPLARLGWAYQQGTLLVDPVGMITMRTGRAGLTLLLLSLACTPLITLTGWEAVGRLRLAGQGLT